MPGDLRVRERLEQLRERLHDRIVRREQVALERRHLYAVAVAGERRGNAHPERLRLLRWHLILLSVRRRRWGVRQDRPTLRPVNVSGLLRTSLLALGARALRAPRDRSALRPALHAAR